MNRRSLVRVSKNRAVEPPCPGGSAMSKAPAMAPGQAYCTEMEAYPEISGLAGIRHEAAGVGADALSRRCRTRRGRGLPAGDRRQALSNLRSAGSAVVTIASATS